MNVGRGLLRGWIFLTVLWLIGAGTLAYFIIGEEISRWKWEYIHQSRTNNPDWQLPYYEIMLSPSAAKLPVAFTKVDYRYVERWDEQLKKGEAVRVKMPDDSSLYLITALTKTDQEYLSGVFWDQRWSRYASFAKVWIPILVAPPIVLFILGWAVLWVCRGFKTAPR